MECFIEITQNWKTFDRVLIVDKSGKGSVQVYKENDYICISDLFVIEPYRKMGLGSMLLREAINVAKKLSEHGKIDIMTNENSELFAGKLYEKFGFKLQKNENEVILNEYGEMERYVLEFNELNTKMEYTDI